MRGLFQCEHDPKADAVAVRWPAKAAERSRQSRRQRVDPASAAEDVEFAAALIQVQKRELFSQLNGVHFLAVKVRAPFPNISAHVVEPICVRRVAADLRGKPGTVVVAFDDRTLGIALLSTKI